MNRRSMLGLSIAGLMAGPAAGAAVSASPEVCKGVRYQDLVLAPMRDGARIALSIWLPDGQGPFPAILMRSLDRRRYARQGELRDALLAAGYAFVNSDVRGRFESDGEFDPTYGEQDGRDGYDTIEWMAAQDWCDARIGTFGLSHMAYYQTSTARQNPPHLKAMATWTGGYRMNGSKEDPPPRAGGVVRLSTTLVWLPNEAGAALDRLEAEGGQDVSKARGELKRMRTHPQSTFEHLPLLDAPITHYAGLKELFQYRLENDARTSLGGRSTDLGTIRTPVFHECGWFDHAAWGQLKAFNALRASAGSETARTGQHMVIGPWQHAMVFQDRLGDIYFGVGSTNQGSGIDQMQVRFFDRYVRGETVELPRVRYFVMGPNEWRTSESWPPAHVELRRYYLHSKVGANSVEGDGVLNGTPPRKERPDRFTYDPERAVPTLGGSFSAPLTVPGMIPGPIEQSPIERRKDVLCYTSAAFERDTEISGPMVLNLFASTSAVDTDFTAKLTHVYPDGRSYNIGEGILRLSGRTFNGASEPVTPGEIYEIRVGLGHTSVVLPQGHALRLQVSSSSFPQWDRNMNSGNPIGVDAHGIQARQMIYHDSVRPSSLEVHAADSVADQQGLSGRDQDA